MRVCRILIIGNSGAGKTTLAKHLAEKDGLAHLDLDNVAWESSNPPKRAPFSQSTQKMEDFFSKNPHWVAEGCYHDLISYAAKQASKLYFLDIPIEECIENASNRPWEAHKYGSKEQQDANLDMLIDWIKTYPSRSDEFSRTAHENLFIEFDGEKRLITHTLQLQAS